MKNLRVYGKAPFQIAVIHGGPGAAGQMAPLAREIASDHRGVLEPLQTKGSLEGQIKELKEVLETSGDLPVALIGFSWGAWLSWLVAARFPEMVKKLILVGSGPFEEAYVAELEETRLSRLGKEERAQFKSAARDLNDPAVEDKDELLTRLGTLTLKTDQYDPITDQLDETNLVGIQGDIFQSVWVVAAKLRKSGQLLQIGRNIKCPVVAIHGDYDPHPAAGVQKPLSATLEDFRFILLENCGHQPWMERQARDKFYRIINQEL